MDVRKQATVRNLVRALYTRTYCEFQDVLVLVVESAKNKAVTLLS